MKQDQIDSVIAQCIGQWSLDRDGDPKSLGKMIAGAILLQANTELTDAVAAEREACAVVCEGMHEEDRPSDYAYAVRARGAA